MKKIFLVFWLAIISLSSIAGSGQDQEKIFSEKYIKKTMKKAVSWQLDHPKHELWDWTNGAFYAGVFAAYETTGSKRILKAIHEMGEKNQWKPGPLLHNADDYAICQTYMDIYRIKKDERMIRPSVTRINELISTPFVATPPQLIITLSWCDALFMAPPTLVKFGISLNEPRYLEACDMLFQECYDLLYDQEEHLFARDIRYKWDQDKKLKEANGEKIFWSRGNGWVMGGLVRMLQELPMEYSKRQFYENLFVEMAKKITTIQQEDGLWRASLLDPDSYPGGEASGSGFYTYALAWGINNNLLDRETYLPVVEKAWKGLNELVHQDGKVGWVQPMGADPRANFSSESWEVFGTGAFLLAASEIIKLHGSNGKN